MSEIEFKSTLQMLVPTVVQNICSEYGLSEYDALMALYESKLYSDLEREPTKLWHLSPLALAELWHQEIETGKIVYPEEA